MYFFHLCVILLEIIAKQHCFHQYYRAHILLTCEKEATAAADDDEKVVMSQNMQIRPAFFLVLIFWCNFPNTDPKNVNNRTLKNNTSLVFYMRKGSFNTLLCPA